MSSTFKLNIQNQTPIVIDDQPQTFISQMKIDPNVDPLSYNDQLEKFYRDWLVKPLFNQNNTQIVDVTDPKQPTNLTPDDIEFAIQEVITNKDIHQEDIDQLNILFNRSMKYSQNQLELNFLKLLSYQVLNKNQLPLPNQRIKYTFNTDILPNAKQLLSQDWNYQTYQQTFGTYSGYFLNDALPDQTNLILLRNDQAYTDLIHQIVAYQQKSSNLNAQTTQLIQELNHNNQFNDLFNTWILPQDLTANSFQRIILYHLFDACEQHPNDYMYLPLNLRTMRQNVAFMFINVDALSHATNQEFHQQLVQIKRGFNRLQQFNITSIKHLMSAQKIAKTKHQIKTHTYQKSNSQLTRLNNQSILTRRKLTHAELINMIIQIAKHQISLQQSENQFKTQYKSFMRANRRHPNDPNYAGQIQRIQYHPDIHVYLDTSGSIDEDEYRQSIKLLILLAKKLNSNFYFTSFSDTITQPVKLHLKNRTVNQIYQEFKQCPKITGGTEFENVWQMIDKIDNLNHHRGYASRLNFVITDFMYDLRQSFIPNLNSASTQNTYYLAVDDPCHEDTIRKAAYHLAQTLRDKGDFSIKYRILI